jgi:hypothetical protein
MNKIYRHVPLSPDEYLGRVDQNGKVYEHRTGPDRYAGRVDLKNGKIYESRLGPDKYRGRVEPGTGKVYMARLGPDRYLGRVRKNGQCYLHRRLRRDEYMGKIKDMTSQVHGGAGFLLLLLPLIEEIKEEEQAALEAENFDDSGMEEAEI